MSRKIALITLSALGGVAALSASAAHAQVYAYLSAPNTQVYPGATIIPNASTEDFSGLTAGQNQTANYSSAIGSYSGTFAVVADTTASPNQFGNGTGNFFAIGAQSGTSTPVALTFATPVTYFGLAYCAGDQYNGFTFYDGTGKNLGRYSTAALLSALQGPTVTTVSGGTYNSSQYYGKPSGSGPGSANTGANGQQPYSFLNFFPGDGTTIKTIVFDNSGTTSSGFESDNHTISTDASIHRPTTGNFVFVGAAAPDASTLPLVLAALPALPLAAFARRRRA